MTGSLRLYLAGTFMDPKGIFKWLALDMLLFVAINAFLILRLGNRLSTLGDLTFFRFMVLSLAAYRAANILSNEAVSKPLRAPFVDEAQRGGKTVEKPKKFGFMGAFGLLIHCPSCTGVWLSAALIYFYLFYPGPTFLIALLLALSAIERIIAVVLGRLKEPG
jgi:hypothetical protein